MSAITKSALVILIIGGINWLTVGLFNLDLVAKLFGGGSALSRIVYILVGVCALYCLSLVFAPRTDINRILLELTPTKSRAESITPVDPV